MHWLSISNLRTRCLSRLFPFPLHKLLAEPVWRHRQKLQGLQQLVCLETVPWYHLCLSSSSQISLLPSCRVEKRSWEWQGAWAGGERGSEGGSGASSLPGASASPCPSCSDGQAIPSNDPLVSSHANLHPQSMLCLQIHQQTKRRGTGCWPIGLVAWHCCPTQVMLSLPPRIPLSTGNSPRSISWSCLSTACEAAACYRSKLLGRVLTIKQYRQSSPLLSPVSLHHLCPHVAQSPSP